jgi:membrane associated rhomboid family serine protease
MAWLSHFWRSLPRGTRLLLSIWIGGSLLGLVLRAVTPLNVLSWLVLDRSAFAGLQLWRTITYALVTQDLFNALFGALFLAFLGPALERFWTPGFFVAYYAACAFTSALGLLLLAPSALPILTNAGALLGVLVAWHARHRSQRFQLFGGPEVPAAAATGITALCILLPAAMAGWKTALALAFGAVGGAIVLTLDNARSGRRARQAAQRPRMGRLEL